MKTLALFLALAINAFASGSVIVDLGQGFTVSVVVGQGDAPFTYQWFKTDATGIPVAIAGATNPSYDVAAATPNDVGAYSVKVKNPAGSTTSDTALVQLTLNAPGKAVTNVVAKPKVPAPVP